mmetsp:Transcript_33574/g.71596  ORF Transcript_33574/g.71596 Transcript_33574/m.71596 type:complete len:211 (+) Transcript_33574:288-920(+)
MKEATHDENVLQVVRLEPYLERLRREAPVAHGNDTLPPRPQDSGDLVEDFFWLIQVIHAHNAGDLIEAFVLKGKFWLFIKIAHDIRRELFVLAQFIVVHAKSHHVPSLPLLGIMTDPRGANIQHVISVLHILCVVLRQCIHRKIVNVEHETRLIVEDGVVGFVLSFEVGGREGPLRREFGVDQHAFDELLHGGRRRQAGGRRHGAQRIMD